MLQLTELVLMVYCLEQKTKGKPIGIERINVGVDKDIYHMSGDGLIGKVKEILNDAKVKRVVIKDEKGKVLLSIRVAWGIC
jgi:hypothetical protein